MISVCTAGSRTTRPLAFPTWLSLKYAQTARERSALAPSLWPCAFASPPTAPRDRRSAEMHSSGDAPARWWRACTIRPERRHQRITATADLCQQHRWDRRRQAKAARIEAVQAHTNGKIIRPGQLIDFLHNALQPGDRVALEGDNQKQADYLSRSLAAGCRRPPSRRAIRRTGVRRPRCPGGSVIS